MVDTLTTASSPRTRPADWLAFHSVHLLDSYLFIRRFPHQPVGVLMEGPRLSGFFLDPRTPIGSDLLTVLMIRDHTDTSKHEQILSKWLNLHLWRAGGILCHSAEMHVFLGRNNASQGNEKAIL